jgi:hypothetical protein
MAVTSPGLAVKLTLFSAAVFRRVGYWNVTPENFICPLGVSGNAMGFGGAFIIGFSSSNSEMRSAAPAAS